MMLVIVANYVRKCKAMRVFGNINVCEDANDGLCAYIRVDRIAVNAFVVMVTAIRILIRRLINYKSFIEARPEQFNQNELYTIRVRKGLL